MLCRARDVGVAQEFPVERGRGLAIDGPHNVAFDICDSALTPDGSPSGIHTTGEDDALPEQKKRHGVLEHLRAVVLPSAFEAPLVAGGAAEGQDRSAQFLPQRGSRNADPLTVSPSGMVMQRRGTPPLPARRRTASLALA